MPGDTRALTLASRLLAVFVVTPDEAIEIVGGYTPDTILTLHPLVAGLDPAVGWQSLHLFAERVLPAIRERGHVS